MDLFFDKGHLVPNNTLLEGKVHSGTFKAKQGLASLVEVAFLFWFLSPQVDFQQGSILCHVAICCHWFHSDFLNHQGDQILALVLVCKVTLFDSRTLIEGERNLFRVMGDSRSQNPLYFLTLLAYTIQLLTCRYSTKMKTALLPSASLCEVWASFARVSSKIVCSSCIVCMCHQRSVRRLHTSVMKNRWTAARSQQRVEA